MIILMSIMFGCSAFLGAQYILFSLSKYKKYTCLVDGSGKKFIMIFAPSIKRIVESISSKKMAVLIGRMDIFLVRSGLKTTPYEFIVYQLISIACFTAAGFLLPVRAGIAGPACLLLAGSAVPSIYVFIKTKKRMKQISRELPYILDMITLSVEAGLDFFAAIQRISVRCTGLIMSDEFQKVAASAGRGNSRKDALIEMRKRLSHPGVDSFVSIVVQAGSLGAPIGNILRSYSNMMRHQRLQSAEKAGMLASQKMLVPLVFFIMPAVFIIVLGPLLIMFMNGTFYDALY